MRLAFDLEATSLLTVETIDYTTSPYTLKDNFKVHCAVFKDIDEGSYYDFVGQECYKKLPAWVKKNATTLIGNNIVAYDLPVMKLALGMDYTIGADTIMGKPCKIIDNMVVSKTLNPDRPAHSVDYWGGILGLPKIDWRAKAVELGLIAEDAPSGAEFLVYHPEMLVYNRRDADVSERIYNALMKEWGKWDWQDAVDLEHAVRDIVSRQEHRGFAFDVELAEQNVRELDKLMEDIRVIVEPVLPPKKLTKVKLKEYMPPKIQFKKNGEPSAVLLKWIEKHGGELSSLEGIGYYTELYGTQYTLPISCDIAIKETEPATVKDTTHIKGWLVGMGWNPTMYKERDLTVDAKKKKLSRETYIERVTKYVEQTLESPFCSDRCDELETTPDKLEKVLLRMDSDKRPVKVYTNPTLTVGMDKEIDPNLLLLADKFPHAKLVSEYLTYSHRRNSILGGGVDPDDEDEEPTKGFLSHERIAVDGRIPTPADTCGAGTSRFKHRVVANIPRVTSLYGKKMRGMFGVGDGFFQMGYDFDSLEAKIESHYVHKYEGGPEYGVSLTAEKPNDCHSVLARSITEILGKPFPRGTAKNVKYGCSYNAQPRRVAKTVGCDLPTGTIIFDAFWEQAFPLKQLKENLQTYWETTGGKKFIKGIDGRKLPIRSKGNVINTAFQSAGVICAKRAMVMHDRMLREEGLAVDFFRDDWENLDFCQQLIAYHDEAQCEVRKESVTFKKFATVEEAKAYNDGRVWSDVIETDKGIFRAYNRAGELATMAVKQSGEYYNLDVELTAGYMIGTNWATCH